MDLSNVPLEDLMVEMHRRESDRKYREQVLSVMAALDVNLTAAANGVGREMPMALFVGHARKPLIGPEKKPVLVPEDVLPPEFWTELRRRCKAALG